MAAQLISYCTNILDIFSSFFLQNTREYIKYSLHFLRNLTKKSLRILSTSGYKMCCPKYRGALSEMMMVGNGFIRSDYGMHKCIPYATNERRNAQWLK